ncbi:putative 2-aminoethylphosphonate ABC transporter permease subunit [Clostridium paraputrificum]|uniref:putative 2-aminoethylphosphonate ABC transporter permease subunit n=1 Tax=Clostridium paraputrificum TaxID=29363 RepID=UPI003D32FA10
MNSNKSKTLIRILILTFLTIFLAMPIVALFLKAFQNMDGEFVGFKNFIDYIPTRGFRVALGHSIVVSITAMIITIVIAFTYAYAINRSRLKFKSLFHWIAILPLFAPTMTHGIALIYLFGGKGIVTSLLSLNWDIYGKWGIIISEVLYIFPVIYLMMLLGLKNADNRLYEVADVLRTSKVRQFFKITLPSMKFSIITACFSAFTMAFTDFGAPKIVGGNYSVLATEVYKKMLGQQDLEAGAVVGILLIIPAILAFIVDFNVSKKNKTSIDSKATEYFIKEDKKRDIILGAFTTIIATIIVSIFIVILMSAFISNWPYDLSFTFKWFKFSILGMSVFKIFANSIFVALLTAILGTALCFIASYISVRSGEDSKINKVIYFLGVLPNAIPGLTIGISFIFFFNYSGNPLKVIYGTFVILVFANIIHFFSNPFLTISNEMKKIDKEYENVAETMKVSWKTLVEKVILPISLPAVIESFSYYFVNSMITVSAVVFLYFPTTTLATISMINKVDVGDTAAASAIAVLIIITNIIFRIVIDKINRKIGRNMKK